MVEAGAKSVLLVRRYRHLTERAERPVVGQVSERGANTGSADLQIGGSIVRMAASHVRERAHRRALPLACVRLRLVTRVTREEAHAAAAHGHGDVRGRQVRRQPKRE